MAAASMAAGPIRESSKDFPRYAATLAELLLRRGSPEDLDNAIAWLRRASAHQALTRDGRAKLLTDLSTALRARAAYRRGPGGTDTTARSVESWEADLDEAIDLMRRAIDLSGDGEEDLYGVRARELAERYAGLGAALLDRGQICGESTALRGGCGQLPESGQPGPARTPGNRRVPDWGGDRDAGAGRGQRAEVLRGRSRQDAAPGDGRDGA